METIKQTIAQNLGNDKSHQLVPEDQQFALDQTPSLDGKVAIITGGSEGIGYGCSHTLLSNGLSKLFILSLSKEVVDGATDAITKELGEETAKKVTWLQCDLSDWHAVKATADKIARSTDRIDILINNAARGIMTYQITDYGVDRHVSRHSQSGLRTELISVIDSGEPHGPRDIDKPSATNHKEDRRAGQHCPHRQPGFECPPSHTFRY